MPSPNFDTRPDYLTRRQLFRPGRYRWRAHPLYLRACEFFSCVLIDRTDTLDFGIRYRILDPMREISPDCEQTFADICWQRAAQIADRAAGHIITVLWSGGIDSTVALLALLHTLEARSALDRLQVLLSKESIAEFPRFFQEVIQVRLAYQILNGTIYDAIDPKHINITGEHGDQLFGSDKLKYAVQTGQAWRPYEDILFYTISRKLGSTRHTDALMAYLEPQVLAAPVMIRTYYDYLWWMNFSLKWQNVSLRLLYGLEKQRYQLGENLVHFFQDPAFQSWSLANPVQKIGREWPSYKYVAKDFINDLFPDEAYRLTKEKEQSLKEVIVRSKTFSFFKMS